MTIKINYQKIVIVPREFWIRGPNAYYNPTSLLFNPETNNKCIVGWLCTTLGFKNNQLVGKNYLGTVLNDLEDSLDVGDLNRLRNLNTKLHNQFIYATNEKITIDNKTREKDLISKMNNLNFEVVFK